MALVDWPSAPLTKSLVIKSLEALQNSPSIFPKLSDDIATKESILQWSTYDSVDHELTYSNPSRVLSCTYVIRKALIRKHFLSRCVQNYITKHPESSLRSSIPRTWDIEISHADELDEQFGDELWDLAQELDKNSAEQWWILKPGMADRGMGIRLFHMRDELVHIFEEFEEASDDDELAAEVEDQNDTGVIISQLRHFVIQVSLSI